MDCGNKRQFKQTKSNLPFSKKYSENVNSSGL